MEVLNIKNLEKSFGKKKVLDGINLSIKPGIFGLLGPNGAGKTTFMKCIVDLLDYNGEISLGKNNKSIKIGYLPQKFSLFRQLTVKEALEYVSLLKKADSSKISIILDEVNLSDVQIKKVKNLSGGMLRRLGIAQALIGDPEILVIDEPTVGLDPKERIRFRSLLDQLSKDIIILISTHIIEDLDAIADYIAIMNNGKIIETGAISSILSKLENKVGIKTINKKEIVKYQTQENVVSSKIMNENALIRIVSDHLPKDCKIVEPVLEDAYFYYIGEAYE